MPSLDDLRAPEAVARAASVTAASRIPRRTCRSRWWSGTHGRGIRPTREGARWAKATRTALDGLKHCIETPRDSRTPGPVALSRERSIAARWLIPPLTGFQDAYPDADVHISVGGGALDIGKDRASLAIRRLDGSPRSATNAWAR